MGARWLLPILCCAGLLSCEESISVEVPEEPPRLVVEGLIRVDTTEAYLPVAIKLSQTAPFFGEIRPVTDVDEISIILQGFDEEGNPSGTGVSVLGPSENEPGVYVPVVIEGDVDERIPMGAIEVDILYTLVITWRGRRYAAQTRYVPAVPIDSIGVGTQSLIDEEETEIIVRFTDLPEAGNYYIFDFGGGEFLPTEDIFYNGQEFEFSYFLERPFPADSILPVRILGADQVFHNYMFLLLEQAGILENPFQVPVATVRGNVFDVTDLDNIETFDNTAEPEVFPLGFFAITQQFEKVYTP